MSLKQNVAVKIVAAYVLVGFVLMEILYLGVWCRPFSQYWAVPPDNSTSRPHHFGTLSPILLHILTKLFSSMFCCHQSFDYQCSPQHLVRHYDHSHPNAPVASVTITCQEKGSTRWSLCSRCIHGMLGSFIHSRTILKKKN